MHYIRASSYAALQFGVELRTYKSQATVVKLFAARCDCDKQLKATSIQEHPNSDSHSRLLRGRLVAVGRAEAIWVEA